MKTLFLVLIGLSLTACGKPSAEECNQLISEMKTKLEEADLNDQSNKEYVESKLGKPDSIGGIPFGYTSTSTASGAEAVEVYYYYLRGCKTYMIPFTAEGYAADVWIRDS
jgi:hypothetical protein